MDIVGGLVVVAQDIIEITYTHYHTHHHTHHHTQHTHTLHRKTAAVEAYLMKSMGGISGGTIASGMLLATMPRETALAVQQPYYINSPPDERCGYIVGVWVGVYSGLLVCVQWVYTPHLVYTPTCHSHACTHIHTTSHAHSGGPDTPDTLMLRYAATVKKWTTLSIMVGGWV